MARKIFVSFDYENDRNYKNLLAAWDANENFAFEFEDHSVTTAVDSTSAGPIKAVITRKMKESSCCLVIIGRRTAKSSWVDWEVANAKALGLGLIAVKIDSAYDTPDPLFGAGASWVYGFDEDPIVKAVRACQ